MAEAEEFAASHHAAGGDVLASLDNFLAETVDTDAGGGIVRATDETERRALVHDSAAAKRDRMKAVCVHCHTSAYADAFYRQYDDLDSLAGRYVARRPPPPPIGYDGAWRAGDVARRWRRNGKAALRGRRAHRPAAFRVGGTPADGAAAG